jgi:hypothetical protein
MCHISKLIGHLGYFIFHGGRRVLFRNDLVSKGVSKGTLAVKDNTRKSS